MDTNITPLQIVNLNKGGSGSGVQFPMNATLNWLASGNFANPFPDTTSDTIFQGNGAPISGPTADVIGASDIMAANMAMQQANLNAQNNLISTGAFDFITNSTEFVEETTMFTKFADQVRANIANFNVNPPSGGIFGTLF